MSGSRGEIVALVREGVNGVAEIAERLDLTHNAVRAHIAALERDGILEVGGKRAGAKRPAILYRLTDAAEAFYARAYQPVLVALAERLNRRYSEAELKATYLEVGRSLGSVDNSSMSRRERVQVAADALRSLGALIEVESNADGYVLRGKRCPLSEVVATCPQACNLGVGLVSAIVGADVEDACVYDPHPACRFLIKVVT